MPAPPPRLAPTPLRAGVLKLVDWRTVAAIGLPIWAFLFGVIVTRPAPQPAVAQGAPVPLESLPAEAGDIVPMPREVVVRTRITPVPVVIPLIAQGETGAANAPAVPAAEFRLPASEVMPAERCQTFDTKVKFHPGLPEAAEDAKTSKKLLLVLHISGHFDDPGFT